MNMLDFLDQLSHISLDGNEKENQILSQTENQKRAAGLSGSKIPFGEVKKEGNQKKKITFMLD